MIREQSSPLNNYHGTAQRGRAAAALSPDHVSVDERSLADLLAYASMYAEKVKFFNLDGQFIDPETEEAMNWSRFFKKDETVFLSSLLASDTHNSDEAIQAAFLSIHQLKGQKEQIQNIEGLITSLLGLTTQLIEWHDKSLTLRDSAALNRITLEIDRAMRGELGYQLHGFAQISEILLSTGKFPGAKQWHQQITNWTQRWPRGEDAHLLPLEDYAESSFEDLLHISGSRLQDYYRRLYFTLSFLDELTPDLFAHSIKEKGNHEPDIGLLIAFLRLFSHAQAELNKFSDRHLEYYNKEVLGRKPESGIPDKAIVGLQSGLAKEGVYVKAGTRLLAGVNKEGLPSHYEVLQDLYVTKASIAAIKTVFISKNPLVSTDSSYQLVTSVYAAPQANSADGLGADFTGTDLSWPILGEDQFDLGSTSRQMTTSTLGFAIASSCLHLEGGERKITLDLQFTPASFATLTDLLEDMAENSGEASTAQDIFSVVFNQPFRLFLTGEEGWMPIEKYIVILPEEGKMAAPILQLQFILPTSAPSSFPYDPGLHGEGFDTSWPVLRILVSDKEQIYSYSFLRDLELEEVTVQVAVDGLRNLSVYNDLGLLDASRPFVPFGPLPKRGSYLLVGHPELFNRELLSFDLDIAWADLPETDGGFADHYEAYGKDISNDSFKFALSALSDFSFQPIKAKEREEFNLFTTSLAGDPPLEELTTIRLDKPSLKKLRLRPLYAQVALTEFSNTTQSGYLKLELSQPAMGFGHSLYPRLFAKRMAENARPRPFSLIAEESAPMELPTEPHTPTINSLSLSYTAKSSINLRRTELKENAAGADDRIFRLHPFGIETVYANKKLKTPYLLPRFDDQGYLYLGIEQLQTSRLLSLYFDIEDSQKKYNHLPLEIQWHYLSGDNWQPFGPDQIISDSTVMFSTRGIVQIYCPADMTKGDGLMDSQFHWIRVSANGNLDITGRCTNIILHAVEASWVDSGDSEHLTTPPEERPPISGLDGNVPGITGAEQLSAFYGGLPAESEEDFYTRGSERLRHKNRAVNIWDYERLVLEKFPAIQQVKCIGQHGYEDELPIGRVLIVVVPRIDGTSTTPKVGYHVLTDIERYLSTLCGPFVDFRVINPVYEPLKVNCKVKLEDQSIHKGGQAWKELHGAITNFICPWLKDGILQLGGTISKTEVLALINENEHVAFATAFSMVQVYEQEEDYLKMRDTAVKDGNTEILTPSRPWSVLVPVAEHSISFLEKDEYQNSEVTAIEAMELETDFIISEKEDNSFEYSSTARQQNKDKFFELPPDWLTG